MEAKTIAMSLLLLSFVFGKIEAKNSDEFKKMIFPMPLMAECCPTEEARAIFQGCRLPYVILCLQMSGCRQFNITPLGHQCPPDFPYIAYQNQKTTGDDVVNKYCKLGCAFSVCATLDNSGEDVNEAVKTCNNACSSICDKNAVEAA